MKKIKMRKIKKPKSLKRDSSTKGGSDTVELIYFQRPPSLMFLEKTSHLTENKRLILTQLTNSKIH